jgi:hypothetical protein
MLGGESKQGEFCVMSVSFALAAFAVAQAAAPQAPINLTCGGAGVANKATARTAYSNGYVSGNVGTTPFSANGSGTTTVYGMRQQGFEDQVDVRLFGGDDRIRLPRTMLPGWHGGDHGWFKMKEVVADERSIRAEAQVNFLNHPKIFIDRVTGTISISGKAGDYAGQCQVIDPDAPAKF